MQTLYSNFTSFFKHSFIILNHNFLNLFEFRFILDSRAIHESNLQGSQCKLFFSYCINLGSKIYLSIINLLLFPQILFTIIFYFICQLYLLHHYTLSLFELTYFSYLLYLFKINHVLFFCKSVLLNLYFCNIGSLLERANHLNTAIYV